MVFFSFIQQFILKTIENVPGIKHYFGAGNKKENGLMVSVLRHLNFNEKSQVCDNC